MIENKKTSLLKNIFNQNAVGAFVLMYHRIAEVDVDPWDLCVSPENFEAQIRYIQKKFDVISMPELAERLQQKKKIKNRIAMTFDDGYFDNYTTAKPILEELKAPATFYLTNKFFDSDVKESEGYWWDVLQQIILRTEILPENFRLDSSEISFSFSLDEDSALSAGLNHKIAEWRDGSFFYNNRIRLFAELSSVLKTLKPTQQLQIMNAVKKWSGVKTLSGPKLMDAVQIKELASGGLFEIGAHTANHPALGYLPAEEQETEILENKKTLEKLVEKKITGFAYPHGHLNEQTSLLLKSAGFHYAVSTDEKEINPSTDLFNIPRYQVKNWTASAFINALKLWQQNI